MKKKKTEMITQDDYKIINNIFEDCEQKNKTRRIMKNVIS
jgi:hypothetical protein